LHERAKVINEAFAVLRDPVRRYAYDAERLSFGAVRPRPPRQGQPDAAHKVSYDAKYVREVIANEHRPWAPLAALSTAYYLLPGSYEWERGRVRDLLSTFMIPPIGLVGWALATGHLTRVVGNAPLASVLAWFILGLASLPLWQVLPRLLLAAGPSALLVTGVLSGFLAQNHIPAWLAWPGAITAGLIISPRLFVFGVLPTLVIVSLLARIS
jgi:hypothetical protein